ncbi:hypothetical protein [Lysobacter gummosus]|uniref:hypothetical protein n=1 Tax=Lysobacter gummosus TaxID=262324 RepID=UPI00362EDFDF
MRIESTITDRVPSPRFHRDLARSRLFLLGGTAVSNETRDSTFLISGYGRRENQKSGRQWANRHLANDRAHRRRSCSLRRRH